MADALFCRWPLGTRDGAAPAGLMPSLWEPGEEALFLAPATAGPRLPATAALYELDQVSDTGPAAERGAVLMLVAFNVPDERTAEVDRWYDEEHIPLLTRAPGWLRARRYRVAAHRGGPRWTSMAFHELRDPAVLDSAERAHARSTPWRAELAKEGWFAAAGRGLFRLPA